MLYDVGFLFFVRIRVVVCSLRLNVHSHTTMRRRQRHRRRHLCAVKSCVCVCVTCEYHHVCDGVGVNEKCKSIDTYTSLRVQSTEYHLLLGRSSHVCGRFDKRKINISTDGMAQLVAVTLVMCQKSHSRLGACMLYV